MTLQVRASLGAPFSIGRVLNDSFRVLGRNFIPFTLITIVFTLPWALGYRPSYVTGVRERVTGPSRAW